MALLGKEGPVPVKVAVLEKEVFVSSVMGVVNIIRYAVSMGERNATVAVLPALS
ncbi:hypothetical protein D3C76_1509270 [compost metagenome]